MRKIGEDQTDGDDKNGKKIGSFTTHNQKNPPISEIPGEHVMV